MKKTHFQKVGAFILSLIILVSALPISAFAAYESHSNMEYISGSASAEVYESLGYGFNALVDEEIKDTTLKYSSGNIINFDAVKASILTTSESKAEEKYSKTVQELMLKLGIDYTNQSSVSVPISAAKVGFSSKFSVNAGVNYKNATDSFYYYYNEETVKEKRSLQLPSALLANPSQIISKDFVCDLDTMSKNFSDEKCKEFFDRWGTHILISYNKGAILEYVATSETSGKELSASLGISYETGASVSIGSISAEATIKKSMDIEAEIKKNEIDASHKWFCMGGDSELIDVDSSNTSLIVDLEKEKWKDSIKDEKSVLLPQSTEWRAIWEFIPDSYYSVKNALQDYYKKTATGNNAIFFSQFTNYSKVIGTELFYTSPTGYTSKITYQTDGTTKVAPGSKFNVVDLDADLNMVKFPESSQYTVDKYGMVTMKATSGNVTVRVTDLEGKDIAGATKTFTVEKEGAGLYAGGYGDEERPYLISNATQFSNIRNHKDANYLLISDINLGTMLPIDEFGGILDGNGYTLSGWNYTQSTAGNIGLFRSNSGTIKNLKITSFKMTTSDPNVAGSLCAGFICGYNRGGMLDNIEASDCAMRVDVGSDSIDEDSWVCAGILCGDLYGGTVSNCIVKESTIIGVSYTKSKHSWCYVGGLIGESVGGEIVNVSSHNNGEVKAWAGASKKKSGFLGLSHTHGSPYAYVGDIVGNSAGTKITHALGYEVEVDALCCRDCDCSGDTERCVGSIIGHMGAGSWTDCYTESSHPSTSWMLGNDSSTKFSENKVDSLSASGVINSLNGFLSNGWIQGADGHPTIAQDSKLEIVGGKRNYSVGEPLNLEDVNIYAVKNDNIKSRSKLFGGFKVSGYDPNKIGEQTLTVTYGKIDGTYTVNVKEPDISEIMISENPYKTSYFKPFEKTGFEGEKLDYSGLAVIAKYDDNHTEEIKFEDLILPESGYVTKSQTVEVEYRGHKAEYEIEAWDVLPSALEVIEGSYKKNYALGDDFDTAGLSVKLTYNNGNTEILGVEDLTIDSSDFDAERPNTYSIIVKYGELETFFDVIVGSIKRISIATNPNKTLYYSSEKKLIADGLSIDVLYDNGATKTVTKGFTVSGYDNTDIGKQDITVAYGGASTTFPIEVVAVEMTSVEISEYPKTSFYVGDEFTVSGLTLKVNYNDGNSKEISNGFTVKLDTFNVDVYPTLRTLGTKKVVITYSENGNRKTTEYDIKVVTDYITELQIVQDPNKTTYNLWDEFSYSGMMVFAVYASGKAELVELSKSMFSIQKFNEPGIQTVALNYEGRSIDVICDVKAPVSIAVMKLPSKIEYEVGESFVADGIEISVYFPDKSSKIIDAASCSLEWPSTDTTGEKTVKVNYASLETVFNVIVKESVIDEKAPQITVDTKKACAGKTVSVNVTLKNNPGLVSLLLSVGYNQSVMKLIGVEDGGIISRPNNSPTYTANPYKLAWEDDTATENYIGNGVLTTLFFEVFEDAQEGEYAITLKCEDGDAFNVDLIDVPVATVNGSIIVSTVLLGDVNGDGIVSGKDRTILSRYLAGWPGYAEQVNLEACDINNDGTVSGKDRTILSRYLAGWGEAYNVYFE